MMLKFHTSSCLKAGLVAAAIGLGGVATSHSAAALQISSLLPGGFEGLWEGIDPGDGSSVQFSIVRSEYGGGYDIISREGFFRFCYNGTTNTLGRGVIQGIGTPTDKSSLLFEFTFTCFNDDTTTGDVSDHSVNLLLRNRGQILIVEYDSLTILHRISE